MNVLVVGYGSIGRRHVDNLLGMEGVGHITVCTGTKPGERRHEPGRKLDFVDSSEYSVADLMEEGGRSFHLAIVANETFKHIDTAILLASHGINLFIEKPLSLSLEGTELLKEMAGDRQIQVFIGYNLRFLGALKLVKGYLERATVGDLYFAKIEVGQYLPSWRPERDYRHSYSARKDQGGGVALDLSHEIDYMRYLFGDPHDWFCARQRVSDLEIDSDDLFEGIYRYGSGFVCNTHMDYLQKDKKRNIRIVGSGGVIECDLMKRSVRVIVNGQDPYVFGDESLFDVSGTYRDELRSCIECIEQGTEPLVSLRDGIQALRLIERADVQG